eukprot:TRINITY_DN10278_c0_g1_i1.p1 TRINITY_DN10278_c0_g1~~TRINITY_DN10278_c0_g1_i1.p1  ORF type:complete len:407 (-),score=116.28 TRINITY_DN10278_c0_g1_i1:61-1281(-)
MNVFADDEADRDAEGAEGAGAVTFFRTMDADGFDGHLGREAAKRRIIPAQANDWSIERHKERLRRDRAEGAEGASVRDEQSAEREKRLYQEHVDSLPESAELHEYEDMPVEDFADALLGGLGIASDSVIGRNKEKATPKPVEYKSRPGRLGLGAKPAKFEFKKDGSIVPKKEATKPSGSSSQPQEKKRDDSPERKKVKKASYGITGKDVLIISGPSRGVFATIEEQLGAKLYHIKTTEGKNLQLSRDEFEFKDDLTPENIFKIFEGLKQNSSKSEKKSESKSDSMWIRPGLRVRSIDKSRSMSKFYTKKGVVVDVVKPKVCILKMDSGETLEDIHEKYLETVIPKVGGKLLVVKGPRKGCRGTLVEKNLDKEKAVVRLGDEDATSDEQVLVVNLDDISEWVDEDDD